VLHRTLKHQRPMRNREVPEMHFAHRTRSNAPQRPVHIGTQQLPTSLTPDADVTRSVLTPFSAPEAPVTKTSQAPRCTTDPMLGPASDALKTVKNTSENSSNPACKLGRRERGSQTHLYRSNSTSFVNVLTPSSVHHHAHVC
jgi:hypothetical protein